MKILSLIILTLAAYACAGGSSIHEEHGSSSPINHDEDVAYKQALIRCHKTGGTRIVKINNKLRCF